MRIHPLILLDSTAFLGSLYLSLMNLPIHLLTLNPCWVYPLVFHDFEPVQLWFRTFNTTVRCQGDVLVLRLKLGAYPCMVKPASGRHPTGLSGSLYAAARLVGPSASQLSWPHRIHVYALLLALFN